MLDELTKTSNKLDYYLDISDIWKTKKSIEFNDGILIENSIIQINHSIQQASSTDHIPIAIYELPDTHNDNDGMCKFIGNYNLNINEFENYFEPYDRIIKNKYDKMVDCKFKDQVHTLRMGLFIIALCVLIIAIAIIVTIDFLTTTEIPLLFYILATGIAGIATITIAIYAVMHNSRKKKIYKAYAAAMLKATDYT